MLHWSIKEYVLPLKHTWSIARNTSDVKHNFVIEVKNGEFNGLGEVAFNVRYQESRELIIQKFEEFKSDASSIDFNGIEAVVQFLEKKDYPQSLKFGIESSFVHYVAALSSKTVPQVLGLNSVSRLKTSFSIPIMEEKKVELFIIENKLERFSTIKIKVNEENAIDFTNTILKFTKNPLRIDANEAFLKAHDVVRFLAKISDLSRVEFIEQPLKSHLHEESLILKGICPVPLMADESVTSEEITDYYVDRFDGVNIKLMKSGGYLKALKQLRQAKILGLKTMLGCMIETSLGISSAMQIASGVDYFDLDGFLFLKDDPFKAVSEENGHLFFSYIQ